MFVPDCRENVCFDQVQKRKRTPLVPVQPDQMLEPARLRVGSQRLSEAPRTQSTQRQVEIVRGLDQGIGRRCQDFIRFESCHTERRISTCSRLDADLMRGTKGSRILPAGRAPGR